ncbi:MAG: hypothetical protein GKR90_14225 [Pseudomonadales bacterium]|nr:hypothetical protein [Pseudomonadales bacterium]
MKTEKLNLSFSLKFAFGFGQLAEGLIDGVIRILLLFYFNQVLGLSASLCGIALLIATIVDAVTDPMMGTISDNWRSRWGRRHPFMYASVLPASGFLFLLFNPPVLTEGALFGWLTVFVVLTRVGQSLYHVPHLALGAELSSDFDERTQLASFRMVFGVAGSLLVAVGFANFFAPTDAFPNGQLNPENYPIFISFAALGVLVSILASSLGTQSVVPYLPVPSDAQASTGNGVAKIVRDIWDSVSNRSFRWLVLAFITAGIPGGIGSAFGLYVNTFFWKLTPSQVSLLLIAGAVATFAGYLIAPVAGRFMEKKTVMIWGMFAWAMGTSLPILLHFAGLFPLQGTTTAFVLLFGFAVVTGLGLAQLIVAVSSMMADVADEFELETGRRNQGVFFGAFSVCAKASGGTGVAVGGLMLDLIDWPTGAAVETAADVPPEVLTHLALLAGPLVAGCFVPFYLCIRNYDISRARFHEIRQSLDTGR